MSTDDTLPPARLFDGPAPAADPAQPGLDRASLLALATVLLAWGVEFLCERLYYADDPTLGFALWTLAGPLSVTAAALAGLLIGVLALRRTGLLARAVTTAFAGAAVASPLVWGYRHHVGDALLDNSADETRQFLLLAVGLLPAVLGLVWLGWRVTRHWFLAPVMAASYAAVMGLFLWYVAPYAGFLAYVETADAAAPDDVPVDVEALYLAQSALLADQIAALVPQTPGKPETYALLLGGTASQSVFRSEVEKVDAILSARYGAGRSLRLVNDDDDAMTYPLANRHNLATGLTALARLMGPEDTAFLYLTSHGCREYLSLSFYEAGTGNLTPDEFAAILTQSGIGPAVIVIGACHSGTFIPALQSPDRLIITAARADRTSFGCADGRDWTEFGQSFFDLALRAEADPRKAFEIARKHVRVKEFWAWRRASLPQMVVGEAIAARLDAAIPPS